MKGNEGYMKKMMKGKSGGKIMKNHGNTSPIMADAQKYDMARCEKRGMERKGYPQKAHDYSH